MPTAPAPATATSRFLALFDGGAPVLQAPMAGSQGSRLALAVAAAGGLGALPAAMLGADALHAELQVLAAAVGRRFNVNFFCHAPPDDDPAREAAWRTRLAPYAAALGIEGDAAGGASRQPFSDVFADVVEPFAPAVVSFHFGLPAPALVARVKRWGALVLSSATTVAEAVWLADQGADVIIAQGLEAGGHRGHFLGVDRNAPSAFDLGAQMGTFALLPQIVDAVRLPVVAAGGIADARGVRAARALGATGIQVGTAYLGCPEAATSAVHRAALADASAAHTALTNVFSGRPARGIVNRAIRELGPIDTAAPAFPLAGGALAPLRARAEAAGSGDFSPLWAGQAACLSRPRPAAELTRELIAAWR